MVKSFFFSEDKDNEFASNTYVVGEIGKPCVVIDMGTNTNRVIRYIKENHSGVAGVLLTHGHYDHIAGLKKFLEVYPCTIFISEEDFPFLTDPKLNCSHFIHGIEDVTLKEDFGHYIVDDEDEINFMNKYYFKVIKTPFHTEGSVCYLLKSENALFTGDTLFKNSIGRSDLPTSDSSKINDSLGKLVNLDPSLNVYPGHEELTNLEHELKTNRYLKGVLKND